MATTTTRLKLFKPEDDESGWGDLVNATTDALDAVAAIGAFAVTPHEVPSESLGIDIAGGVFVKSDGETYATFAGEVGYELAPSTTTYLWIDDDGDVQEDGAGWPATPCLRLAVVITDADAIASIVDARTPYRVS